jgi:hypothetical protein
MSALKRPGQDRNGMANLLTRVCLMIANEYDDQAIRQRIMIDCGVDLSHEDLLGIKHALGFAADRAVAFVSAIDLVNVDIADLLAIIRKDDLWASVDLGRTLADVCQSDREVTLAEIPGITVEQRARHAAAIRLGLRMAKDVVLNRLSMSVHRHRPLMEQAGITPEALIAHFGLTGKVLIPTDPLANRQFLRLKRGQKLS